MTALYHAYTQTVADGTATSVVRPSDWNSAHVQGQTLSGNTAGVSSFTGTNFVLQGGNNVTLSAATAAGAATIVISGANTVAQTVQTQASGAIAGTGFTSTTTAGTAITAAMGNNGLSMAIPAFLTTYAAQTADTNKAGTGFTSTTVAGAAIAATLGTDGLSMAVPAFLTTSSQSVQTQASGAIAGTGFTSTTTAGTAITAAMGTNGLSMAVPAFITTYVNDLTSGRAGTGFTSTTTAGTAITAALGTNGLSMAVPAYITTYVAQTTQTQAAGNIAGAGYTSTTQAGSTVGITQNSNGLSAAWPAFITTATQSADTNKAGTGFTSTTTAGTAITAALGTNGLSMAVPAYITTYVNDLTSGRAGTGFTSTTTAGTAITAALGTNGLSMAVPAYITTFAAQTQQPMYFSASGTSTSANTIQFGNSNGVSFSLSNGSVIGTVGTNYAGLNETTAATNALISLSLETNGVALSVNVPNDDFNGWNLVGVNTSGTTATTLTTTSPLYLQGGNNITLSGNSNTIVISGGGGGVTNQTGPNIAVAGSTVTAGTVLFSNANSVTFGMAGSTITASVGGFTASGYNHYNDVVQVAGQVGQGTLNFDPVNLDFPVQFDRFGVPIAYTATSNSTGSQTISMRIGIYTNNAGTLSLLQSASTAVTAANSGTAGSYSIFSGFRLITIPFTTTLQPNDYWMGVISSTSSSSQNGASISAMLQSNLGSNFVGFFGQSNNTTQQYTLGQGVYTATTNAMPVSVAFSQIRGSDSNAARPPIVGWYSGTV